MELWGTELFVLYWNLSLWDIDLLGAAINQIVGEVVNHTPVEILVHVAEAVALGGQVEHVETLACTNKSIHYS